MVTRAGFGREDSSSPCCFASHSCSSFAFEILSLFPTASLGVATDEGAVRSENAIDRLWAPAALVVDVVGRAGRIAAGVNREHGIGTFAESTVRLLYDFFYHNYFYCQQFMVVEAAAVELSSS
jgi:hypothetical protein